MSDDLLPTEQTLPIVKAAGFRIHGEPGPLFAALAKAQLEFSAVLKKKAADAGQRGQYKYADLAETFDATRDALNNAGLAFSQPLWIDVESATCAIHTILGHGESGAYMESVSTFDANQDTMQNKWQALGSAITYCKRYSAQGTLGVAPEQDDDGASAGAPTRQSPPPTRPQPKPPQARQEAPRQKETPKPQPAPQAKPEPDLASAVADAMLQGDDPEPPQAAIVHSAPVADTHKVADGEDRPYHADETLRTAINKALQDKRLTIQEFKRYCFEKFGINPAEVTDKLTIAQGRIALVAARFCTDCSCPPGTKCVEKGRMKS